MPFEDGNDLGKKTRLFEGALKRAITQEDGKRLRAAAEKLLTAASKGEPWAIGMLADRLDGKPKQQTELTGADGADLLQSLTVVFKHADQG